SMARISLARKKKLVTLLVLYMDLLNQLFFMTYLTTIIILRYRSLKKKSGGNSYHRHLVRELTLKRMVFNGDLECLDHTNLWYVILTFFKARL
ncbi:protein ANTAGONIST OF LIKE HETEROCHROMATIN PROTEIN 1-like, partial [Fagus crenata]